MDVQTIEQRLKDLDYLRVIVPALEEQLARINSTATGSRVELREGPGGGSYQSDKVGAQVAHTDNIERLIAERKPELNTLKAWATTAIMRLDMREQDVMRLRYLDGRTMQQVADALHYTTRNTYSIRADAVKHMSQI